MKRQSCSAYSERVDDTFDAGADSITVANNYFTQKVVNLPKGTYHLCIECLHQFYVYQKQLNTGAASNSNIWDTLMVTEMMDYHSFRF